MSKMPPDVKAYFDTLPKNIQAAVVESAAEFKTVEQLKVLAKAYSEGIS